MNIPFMRGVDRIVGVPMLKIGRVFSSREPLPASPKRILIIKLFGFGNFIFLSPVFSNLKRLFPNASIEVLTFSQNKEICEMYGLKVHTLRFKVRYLWADLLAFAARHRRAFDIAIDYEQFVRLSAIAGWMCSPRYFIGLCTPNSKKHTAYDLVVDYVEDRHIVEEFYTPVQIIAKMLGKKVDDKPVLSPPKMHSSAKVREAIRLIGKGKIIGVCPGGRADDVERRYPLGKFVEALNLILKRKDVKLVFFGSPSERKEIEQIISKLDSKKRCYDAAGLSLSESAELISRTQIFISNDTGPIHLAASLGVYCVGLYGPSKQWVYGPYTKRSVILRHKHPPARSNHNEKDVGWSEQWWPEPEKVYKQVEVLLRA